VRFCRFFGPQEKASFPLPLFFFNYYLTIPVYMIELPVRFFHRLFTITLEDWIYLVFSALVVASIVGLVLITNPQADAQYRYFISETGQYLGLDGGEVNDTGLTFSSTQIENVNWATTGAVSTDNFAHERLFCGSVSDSGLVEEFRFADKINDSGLERVSGSCTSRFGEINLFVHTHPTSGSARLSEEDRDLESAENIDYTCIVFDEITSSPFSDELHGISCWRVVEGSEESYSFEEIPAFLD